jgi:hypothetical protein
MSGVERAQAEPAKPAEEGCTRLKGVRHWPPTKRFHLRMFSNTYLIASISIAFGSTFIPFFGALQSFLVALQGYLFFFGYQRL